MPSILTAIPHLPAAASMRLPRRVKTSMDNPSEDVYERPNEIPLFHAGIEVSTSRSWIDRRSSSRTTTSTRSVAFTYPGSVAASIRTGGTSWTDRAARRTSMPRSSVPSISQAKDHLKAIFNLREAPFGWETTLSVAEPFPTPNANPSYTQTLRRPAAPRLDRHSSKAGPPQRPLPGDSGLVVQKHSANALRNTPAPEPAHEPEPEPEAAPVLCAVLIEEEPSKFVICLCRGG
ncbi:hypothetical protein T484DRAFT_1777944 [Baffinella frigidus]|nr:hypothetical protein T484DRAFT_1777944 [Cryptophyta sp. CCMP2293]